MKKKIFSILFALVLACSFSLVTAVPAGAKEVPNPTFATVDRATSTTPSEQITIGWERDPEIPGDGYSGTDAIHVTTSGSTSLDFAMVIVPTDFTLTSETTISYWGYTVSGSAVKAPDEIFLFLDTVNDGQVDTLLTSHKPGPAASAFYGTWDEWSLTGPDNDWHIVDPPDNPYGLVELDNYIGKGYTVLAIALTAGPSTTSGAVNVDVYFDRLTVNGNVLLDNDTGTIDVPEPFPGQLAPCIQDAIDAALPSDTISVAAGTYDLIAPIAVDKSLTLTGDTTTPSSVVINAGTIPVDEDRDCFQVKASDVTIQGFKMQGAIDTINSGGQNMGVAIGTHWAGEPAIIGLQNIVLSYNEITDCSKGIYVYRAQHITISHNKIHDCPTGTEHQGSWPGKGIELRGDDPSDEIQNYDIDILDNEIYNNGKFGIELNHWETTGTTWIDVDVLIDGNTIYNNGGPFDAEDYAGYYFGRGISANGWETGVTITNNEIYGHWSTGEDFYHAAAGIRVNDAKGFVIQNNDVHDNMRGIYIYGAETTRGGENTGFVVTGNDVHDNAQGIVFGDGDVGYAEFNNIHGNDVTTYVGDDVSPYGAVNLGAGTFDATNNYWGNASGPYHETTNPSGTGDPVSDNVHYSTWCAIEDTNLVTPGYQAPTPMVWGVSTDGTIQEAIDDASPNDTISVAAGTYTEAILIDKPLILRGATAGVNKNGYTVPADSAWDDTVESIINHPNPSGGYDAIVDIVDTNDITFEGFVVQELDAVGNLNSSLVRVYAHTQEISNIVVRNNIIGPNTNTSSQDGAQGRMGLYIVNHPYSDQGVINSTFSGNKVFDCKGNGNNVFIWSSYFAYGAPSPASMIGTVIEDNEIYGSHRSGIETAGGFSGLTIRNNKIYGNSGLPSDDPGNLKYGNGILLIRGSSDKLGGPTTAFGPENLTIEDNEIYNNEKNGIYAGPINKNYTITGNKIHDNGWDGIMVDLEGQYWNPTFEDEPDPWNEHACYDGSENIAANLNNIYDNDEYGVRVIGTPTNGFVLDATYNWWGHASGPGCELSNGKWVGKGDKVSDNVDYKPWLHKLKKDVVPTKKPAFARSVVLDNTGDYGWNTFSAPIFLDAEADTWKELCDLADLAYSVAYRFDSDIQEFVPLTTPDDYDISPGEGFFIKMNDAGSLSILYSTEENLIPPSRPLTAEWNLIGLASLKNMKVSDAFASIATVPGLAGYSQVVSPIGNAEQGPVLADGTIYVGESYWVYMLGERTLAGFTMTPVEWVP